MECWLVCITANILPIRQYIRQQVGGCRYGAVEGMDTDLVRCTTKAAREQSTPRHAAAALEVRSAAPAGGSHIMEILAGQYATKPDTRVTMPDVHRAPGKHLLELQPSVYPRHLVTNAERRCMSSSSLQSFQYAWLVRHRGIDPTAPCRTCHMEPFGSTCHAVDIRKRSTSRRIGTAESLFISFVLRHYPDAITHNLLPMGSTPLAL